MNDKQKQENLDKSLLKKIMDKILFIVTLGEYSDEKNNSEIIKNFLFALVLAVIFRSFIFDPYHIPSGSMKPNLIEGDYIFVSKFKYGYSRYSLPFGINFFPGRILEFDKPKRGDIIVFKVPNDNNKSYIKRLIGLPGDNIQVKSGILYINDVKLDRKLIGDYNDLKNPQDSFSKFVESMPDGKSYEVLDQLNKSNYDMDNTPIMLVPEDHYFFMGDNRDNSSDSRVLNKLGFVPAVNIIGRAEIVFFSSGAKLYEIWKWPFSFKLDRFFINLHSKKEEIK